MNPYNALIINDKIINLLTYAISKILFGKFIIDKIIGWVVAPTNPAINAAAKIVCCLKYGIKYPM